MYVFNGGKKIYLTDNQYTCLILENKNYIINRALKFQPLCLFYKTININNLIHHIDNLLQFEKTMAQSCSSEPYQCSPSFPSGIALKPIFYYQSHRCFCSAFNILFNCTLPVAHSLRCMIFTILPL